MMMPYLVDQNVSSAICLFFLFGLQPGSYTEKLLLGHYDFAKYSAHPNLLCPGNGDGVKTPHDFTVEFVNELPMEFRMDNYITWNGFYHLSDDKRKSFLDHIDRMQVESMITGEKNHICDIIQNWLSWGANYGK